MTIANVDIKPAGWFSRLLWPMIRVEGELRWEFGSGVATAKRDCGCFDATGRCPKHAE